jgi:superfamily I DNA and/or RNA helicase
MSQSANDQLKELQKLLRQEKREDLVRYENKMQGSSFKQRRDMGVLWYPVFVDETKFDAGERLLIKVVRTPEHKQYHSFQSGKSVTVFLSSDSNVGEVNGVINQVKEFHMIITLNCDEVPNWIERGGLGVQLLFDENSYREMEFALKFLIESIDPKLNDLKDKLLGVKKPDFSEQRGYAVRGLNTSQNNALSLIKNANDIAFIHGPPGTGKTTTIVEAIYQTLKSEHQVMVCAPSNAAVDLLVEKLSQNGLSVVRMGHPARVTDEILNLTLDAKVASHQDFKLLKSLKKQSEEYFNLSGKWKRNFGASEREQRKFMLSEARKLRIEAQKLSNYITNDVLLKCQIVACTLVGASHKKLKGMRFTTVFMDEAGQALEPASWIPVLKADRIIMAGDHQQLPPTIKSFEAGKKGLSITLFEKAIRRNDADVMLKEQYRMHEKIMRFSSVYFYDSNLKANESVAQKTIFTNDSPLEFIDTAGTGFFESVNRETKSSLNKEEAVLVFKHLEKYWEEIKDAQINPVESIGIISPYKAQIEVLNSLLIDSDLPKELKSIISINTVDSFQGQERDIIYISLVRSNETGQIGFLSDERRMNVAMTRAKMKLVIVGDSATIASKNKFYNELIDYVNSIDAYKSAFELMY